MKKALISFTVLILLMAAPTVWAGTFYLHDHPSYWWYTVSEPAFSAVIPSSGENYIQRSIFGMEVLEILFENGAISMEVVYQPGTNIEVVRQSVEDRFKPLVKNASIIANREITTSNNLKSYFYAYEGTGLNGKKVMLRSVFFQRDKHIVYLIMCLDSAKYQGDIREYWLRAVNGFEWN